MPLLELDNVSKTFPGVRALDGVDFDVRAGEIHALLGENGAGKSTLVKVMTGVYTRNPDKPNTAKKSAIKFCDQELSASDLASPANVQKLGISTVYQEVNLLPNLSVAQNIFLGREPKKLGFIDWKTVRKNAGILLQRFNLNIDVTRPLSDFSVAVQQLIAIARSVDMSAKLLILDEPTASLDTKEVETLFHILSQLRSEGMGIVFITHFLDQVYEITDRITVLRNGRKVGCFQTSDLPRATLIQHMLGKELQKLAKRKNPTSLKQEPLKQEVESVRDAHLRLKNITVGSKLTNINLDVAHGQTVGFAGLLGSGRTEVCETIFAITPYQSGTMHYDGNVCKFKNPSQAITAGIALCPEDRKSEGIIGELSVRENIVLATQVREGWWRSIRKHKQNLLSQQAIQEFGIVTSDAEKPINQLSGGNQQKVILARWLATHPKLLMLDEPTRGIDIGAHVEIIKLIKKVCAEGMTVLVTSSEIEELVAFSDQIVVMRDGKQVAELSGNDISEANILAEITNA